MSRVWTCGDPGSTHDGSLEKALDLVNIAADLGLDAVKFQLLTPDLCKSGNVMLPWEWLPELMARGKERGVEVFASVFNEAGRDWVWKCGCDSIKYAYSQQALIRPEVHKVVFASFGVMDEQPSNFEETDCLVPLFCVPQYPVPFIVDFEGIFDRFAGFSSHCLGVQQEINAVRAGARYLEFHFQGNWKSPTPDGKFAKSPELTRRLVQAIRDLERPYHPHDGYGAV